MKEIDINIEGYNVNGICVACLNYNRKMYHHSALPELFKILADVEIGVGLSIKVCWECLAAVKTICRFQKQVNRAYDYLIYYSRKHPFLNSPQDLSMHATQRLSQSPVYNLDEVPAIFHQQLEIKSECDDEGDSFDGGFEDFDVNGTNEVLDVNALDTKVKQEAEINEEFVSNETREDLSSDEDIQLSKLKRKKERGEKKIKKDRSKKKKEKELRKSKSKDLKKELDSVAAPSKTSRKLLNLPENLVELYTMTEKEMWQVRAADLASKEFLKLKYKCENCILGFHSEKHMTDHMNGKHRKKSEDCEQCDVCKAYLLTKDNLSTHRSLHLTALRCMQCHHISTLKQNMQQHAKEHLPNRAFSCDTCNDSFNTKSKLSYHKNVCHQERPQCDCCGKVFANKMTLKYHLKLLPQNKSDKPKEKLYIPCKGCNKVFHNKKSYRAHVVIHDGLTYPCPICGKLFQWKRNLSRHTRNHREKDAGALHECRECGKTFSSRDCYNNHMKLSKRHVPQDALSHQCNYCGKKFATKWCMVDHIDWDHLKRIKYQCSVCFKAFKTAKIMVAHMNNIHEGKKNQEPEGEHLCEICGKSYKTVRRLKGHVWAMHTNRSTVRRFKCKLCPATFTWQTSIYKHTKMMHSPGKRPPAQRQIASKTTKPVYPDIVSIANLPAYFGQNDIQPTQHSLNVVHNIPQYPNERVE